jgi:uncharacterized protein with ATP-grasp and redox domains
MSLVIPPPLMTSEPGSFARHTIVVRKPQIIRRVLQDNPYPADIVSALEDLRDEIARLPVRGLPEEAFDHAVWQAALAPLAGRTWLELPWFLAEAYFYRRLLEATRYFQPGRWRAHDPFGRQKSQQIVDAALVLDASTCVDRFGREEAELAGIAPEGRFEMLLHAALWGNRADLSNLTVQQGALSRRRAEEERQHILINHTEEVGRYLAAGRSRVDFVCDNVGHELLWDLALADWLLVEGGVGRVVLHLKSYPFFVSDATRRDLEETVVALKSAAGSAAHKLGRRLGEHLQLGRLRLEAEPFWTAPLMFRQMPPDLRGELAQADLVVLKGDANYRRLVDDAHWPPTADLGEIAAYFPAPLVAVRTLKAEVVVGLAPGQAEALTVQEPDWLVNGRRGLIHFVPKNPRDPWTQPTQGES